MSDPAPGEALDIVRRLEAALLALERDVAALDTGPSPPPRRTERSALETHRHTGTDAAVPRAERSAPLSPEEHRRLKRHLEAVLGEVRELADFLATGDSDPDRSDPR